MTDLLHMKESAKKKVLFLITKSNWGGAQRYVFDLATTLDTEKFEVLVALGEEGELAKKLHEANIPVVSIPGLTRDISLLKELRATLAIAGIIKKEKPDVLHVNSSKAGFLGTCIGRILRVKNIIFTAHGWAFNEDRPKWQQLLFKTVHWMTVMFSHRTIAVSHAIKKQMDWPLVQKKLKVINPGRTITDLKNKQDSRGILETKVINNTANLGDYHADIWIGTIAELHPIKQLHRAINSVASLSRTIPNIRYVIIGDGQLASELQQQVTDIGLEQHVFFTGSLDEASRFLPAFDIFVLPSHSEAYGYVLLEAGIAHVPVIATNIGGIPDIITHEETGLLVPPDNTPLLTEALQTLLTDKNLRIKLADAHYEHAQTRTVEKMTTETTAVYVAYSDNNS
ncbi:MAG: glycosyltransferase involved in cell wall biosynthesis [Acidimicrobiales bacterium]|jgi:glycosyltransferase involved in cell wall biosynthesis